MNVHDEQNNQQDTSAGRKISKDEIEEYEAKAKNLEDLKRSINREANTGGSSEASSKKD